MIMDGRGHPFIMRKKKESSMNQQEIFTYIQKQYLIHPDTITKSGYPVTIFKNPRTTEPYAIFYQPAEKTTFMEVQAEPDMIGNYIEMYHLAPAKHMDQKHWLAVPLDGSVSDSKVLDLLDMSYDLVDGQAEADGETEADGQATDSTKEEKD
ncbi:MmcQ/YjbR family DNA-binding protein [Dorea formicigenerans]|uniref:MmcQ/YjbR family DNA-binding protein n=1 Tax=Dorea formicigenerans TaxID=39486 RepID=UPI0032BFBEB0